MADVESNINVNIDTSNALASIKRLQAEISTFHQQMAKGGAAAAASSAQLQQGLVNSINSTGNFSASMTRIKSSTEAFTTSLEKNKFSMGEYFRYAGASTKTFGRLFSSEFETINKVARERVKDLQTQYIKLGRDANGAMRSVAVRPLALDMNDLGTKTAIAAQKQQLFNQLMKQGSTNLLNFGKNTQWAGRQLMVGFTVPLTIMGAAAAREFKNIEEQVVRFKRVYGDAMTSPSETDAMANNLKTLAREFTQYGISVANTMKLAADAAAMGKTGADLTAQVTQASRLSALGNVDQQKALETTTSLTSTFSIAAKDLAKNINFLNAVENQTVTSIEDLTTAIPTAAPVIQQLGGNVQDLAFFLTAMREGGINASEGANALKSGLASMINPTSQATAMLESFGINLQGIMDKDKGNVKQMVIDLGAALNSLDPTNRAQAIEQMFGKFQFARMSTLFQNVTKEGTQAARVLDLTNQSSAQLAILSERELKRVSDSPLYKFEKAIEDFKASLAPVGEAFLKAVTPIIEWGGKVLEWFNGWNDQAKNIGVVLAIAIGGLGPLLLMAFGLIANGAANIIKMFMGLKNMFQRIGGSSKVLGEQLNYMTQEQLQAATVAASLDQAHNKLRQTFTSEASAIGQLIAQYQAATAAQSRFMSAPGNVRKGRPPVKKADGGIISGPGTGTSDSIPAMLSNGEAVISADVVKKYPGLVQGLIAGNVKKLSNGGLLGENYVNDPGQPNKGKLGFQANFKKLGALGYSQYADEIKAQLLRADVSVSAARKIISRAVATAQSGGSISEFIDKMNVSLTRWKNSGSKNSQALVSDIDQRLGLTQQRDERAKTSGHFAHIGSGVTMSASEYKEKYGTTGLNQTQINNLERLIKENKTVAIKSGLGMSNFNSRVNNKLDKTGASQTEVLSAYKSSGINKWNESIRIGGGNVKELAGAAKIFDQKLQGLIAKVDKDTVMFDKQADAERYMAENAGKAATSLEKLYASAIRTADPKLREALTKAQSTPREVRMGGSRKVNANLPPALIPVMRAQAEKELKGEKARQRGKTDAEAYAKAKKQVLDKPENDSYEQTRDRKSPHKKAKPDGIDDAKAYDEGRSQARSDAAKKGWETRRAKAAQPQMESYTKFSDVTRMVGTNAAIFASKSLVAVGKGFQNLRFVLDKTMLDLGYNIGRAKDIIREASTKIYNGLFRAAEGVVGAAFKVTTVLKTGFGKALYGLSFAASAVSSRVSNAGVIIYNALFRAAEGMLNLAFKAKTVLVAALQSVTVPITNFALSIYSKVVPSLVNATVSVMRFGESIAIKLINAFSTAQVALVKFAGPAFFKLSAALTNATTAITSFATNLYSKVSTALISATNATANFGRLVLGNVVRSLDVAAASVVRFGASLTVKLITSLGTATNAIIRFAGPTYLKLASALTSAISIMGRFAVTIGRMIQLPILRALPSIIRFGGAVAIRLMRSFDVAYGGLVRFTSNLVNTSIRAFGNATNAIIRFSATVATPLVKAFTIVKTKVAAVLAPMTTAISGAFSATSTKVKSVADGIKSKVSGAFESLKDKMSSSTSKMANKVSDGVSKAGSAFSRFIDSVKAKVNTLAASPYVGVTQTGQRDLTKKEQKAANKAAQQKAALRSQRLAGMGSMASMGLMMGSSMLPEGMGAAGSILGATGMGASMGAMLGPWGAGIGAALGLVSSSAMAVKEAFDGAQRSAEAFAKTTGASAAASQALATASGKVSATEEMKKRRLDSFSSFKRTDETNAVSQAYLQSDAGKAAVTSLGESNAKNGIGPGIESITAQMSTAIAEGSISRIDAKAIVEDMGKQLGDKTFALRVNAKVDELVGANGENLERFPIVMRVKILEQSQKQITAAAKNLSLATFENSAKTVSKNTGGVLDANNTALNAVSGFNPIVALMQGTAAVATLVDYMGNLGSTSAVFASNVTIAASQSQAMLDSLQLEYEKRIEVAKAAGDTAEADRLAAEYQKGRTDILTQSAANTKKAASSYNQSDVNMKTAVIGSIDQQIKDTYSGTPQQAAAQGAIDKLGGSSGVGGQAEFIIKSELGAGTISPATLDSILTLYKNEGADASILADLVMNVGGADADKVMQFANMAKEPQQTINFIATMKEKNPEETTKILGLLDTVGKSGGQEAVQAVMDLQIRSNGKGVDAAVAASQLEVLQRHLKNIDSFFADGKQKTYDTNLFYSTFGFQLTKAQAEYFNSLPPDQQKTYISAYVTVKDSIDASNPADQARLRAWASSHGKLSTFGSGGGYSGSMLIGQTYDYNAMANDYAGSMATGTVASSATAGDAGTPTGPDNGGGGGGGGGEAPRTIAEVISDQQKRITTINNQTAAVRKLVAAGLSLADAYAIASNAEDAALIANGANAAQLADLTAKTKAAEKATKDLAAATNAASAALDIKEKNDLAAKLASDKTLTDIQKRFLLENADAARLYMNPTFDPAALRQALLDAQNASTYEFNINKVTIPGLQDIWKKGMENASQAFSAQQNAIEIKFKIQKDPFKNIIEAGQRAINDIQNRPGGLDDLDADLQRISDKEFKINKAYDDKVKALEEVSKINDRIIAQQKSQIGLAEALTQGDIAAAARAAQDMRGQDATTALADQRSLLDQGRKSEIDALTGTSGLTRDQIEEKIRDLKAQVLEIEERRIEPAQRQMELLERQQQDQIDALTVLGKTKEEWDGINASLELANTKTFEFQESMRQALSIATQLGTALANAQAPSVYTPPATPTTAPAADPDRVVDYNTLAAQVRRGDWGNGQNRVDRLMAAGYSRAEVTEIQNTVNRLYYSKGGMVKGYMASGGMVKNYLAKGGFPNMPKKGTDRIPAMLTAGEFVMSKPAVDRIGTGRLAELNRGYDKTSNNSSDSVYNYSINVNANTNANPSEIAQAVSQQIRNIDYQRVKGNRF
jgi:hypothetical protein